MADAGSRAKVKRSVIKRRGMIADRETQTVP